MNDQENNNGCMDTMHRNSKSSSNHSERMGTIQTDLETSTVIDEMTGEDDYTEVKAYRQLRPLLVLMKIFGLYYKRCVDKHGVLRTEKWMYYCIFINAIMVFNVLRSFTVYRFGDDFNHALVQKVLFTIWSSECALKGIILTLAYYRKDGFPHFFTQWKSTCHNDRLDKVCLFMMKKYICLTFLFLIANSVVFILVLMYVPLLDDIYVEVVWRGALKDGRKEIFKTVLGLMAPLLSTSSMFPVSLFVVLSSALGKQMNKLTEEMHAVLHDEDFYKKIEYYRIRHQKLCMLIKTLDKIFAPMIAAIYSANIPMFCLVLYTMLTSIDIHVSLTLLNLFWLCFILLQMTIVSITAAWVNIQAHSPLEPIYTVKFSNTSNDTQLQVYMFLNKLTGTQIGFTAMKMFVVDRPTILTGTSGWQTKMYQNSRSCTPISYSGGSINCWHDDDVFCDIIGVYYTLAHDPPTSFCFQPISCKKRTIFSVIAGMMMTYFVILLEFKLPQDDCYCNVTGAVNLDNSTLDIKHFL